MYKAKKIIFLAVNVSILISLFTLQSFAQQRSEPLGGAQSRVDKYEKLRREELSMSFAFYGKVVDLDGEPVSGAKVFLRIRHIPALPEMKENKEIQVNTDDQGRFSIKGEGFLLALDGIEKKGYEYRFQYSPNRQFRFHKGLKKAGLGQFPEKPVIFKMRKKGTPTLVITGSAWPGLAPGDVAFVDLLWQQWGYPKNLWSLNGTYKGWHPDLRITLEGDRKNPKVVLETIDSNTGILIDDRELYEAPHQGYQSKILLPFKEFAKGGALNTFAYVKGRGGKFYTKVRIEAGVGNRDDPEKRFAEMRLLFTTNPNGEGNFEPDAELMRKYLESVRSGKRRPFGYDPTAKPYTVEDIRRLLGEK